MSVPSLPATSKDSGDTIGEELRLKLASKKGEISKSELRVFMQEMQLIPKKIETLLKIEDKVKEIAAVYKNATNCLYCMQV